MKPTIPLSRALAGTVAIAILAGLVPAGIVLDRRLVASLEERARSDLELAPRLLADRNATYSDAIMMHAKEFAHAPGLADALAGTVGSKVAEGLLRVVERSRPTLGDGIPLVIGRDGAMLIGPRPDQSMIDGTREGKMPVKMCTDGEVLRSFALAPVVVDGEWMGAAGVASPLGDEQALALAGLTRSGVIIISSQTDAITATTVDTAVARALHTSLDGVRASSTAQDVLIDGERYIAVTAPLDDAGRVLFVRRMRDELALLPSVRRTAAISAAAAVALALALGMWLATRVSAPVGQLARAARALGDGEFDAPLPQSRLSEVASVSARFDEMRTALAARLAELRETALQLKDRNARLTALQSDLMQRERLAASGRLVAQLAHEIRNPVANLRNCLEVVHRRVEGDPEAREFVELAIDELLRMHELAEQMLDLNRPRDQAQRDCLPARVAGEVARLAVAGIPRSTLDVRVSGDPSLRAAIAPDALKQVLLNLVQNAREAGAPRPDSTAAAEPGGAAGRAAAGVTVAIDVTRVGETVRIEVGDNGPGVTPQLRERIFDPFFSTKSAVQGVGLGLFVAEGLVRGIGGQLSVTQSSLGGAAFILDLPLVQETADERERREVAGPATSTRRDVAERG
ncbi:MAG: HAMP domain-containing sensor histidine kinase [Gemmatimonadota bacterium]